MVTRGHTYTKNQLVAMTVLFYVTVDDISVMFLMAGFKSMHQHFFTLNGILI